MSNSLKSSKMLILMVWGVCCYYITIFSVTKIDIEKSSIKDKCNSIGMLYQSVDAAPGYKLCYGVDSEGKLIYKEIK